MNDTSGPADTMMMGVMHDAMRRDFVRVRDVLASSAAVSDVQRAALADHLDFMLTFLHEHHTNEDRRLWPLVRAHDPSLGDLLDRMSEDHVAISASSTAVADGAHTYRCGNGDGERRRLVAALDQFNEALLPHLSREVDEVMPRVSDCLSAGEWKAFEKDSMPPISVRALAEYFNWFLDGLDEDRRRKVKAHLPAPIVFTMTGVFGPGYRRRAAVRWAGAAA